jgi:hypothetical protein
MSGWAARNVEVRLLLASPSILILIVHTDLRGLMVDESQLFAAHPAGHPTSVYVIFFFVSISTYSHDSFSSIVVPLLRAPLISVCVQSVYVMCPHFTESTRPAALQCRGYRSQVGHDLLLRMIEAARTAEQNHWTAQLQVLLRFGVFFGATFQGLDWSMHCDVHTADMVMY